MQATGNEYTCTPATGQCVRTTAFCQVTAVLSPNLVPRSITTKTIGTVSDGPCRDHSAVFELKRRPLPLGNLSTRHTCANRVQTRRRVEDGGCAGGRVQLLLLLLLLPHPSAGETAQPSRNPIEGSLARQCMHAPLTVWAQPRGTSVEWANRQYRNSASQRANAYPFESITPMPALKVTFH